MVDFFNASFLAFLGILVLAIAILVVYFESKSREQNHKIASMFSVVSALAEDLNNVKIGVNQLAFNGFNGGGPTLAENINPFNATQEHMNLIEVSDNDYSDDEEDLEEDENESDEDELDEDESDEDELDEVSDEEFDDESELMNVKVLKIEDPLLDPLLEKVEQKFDVLNDLNENVDSEYDQETFEEEPLQLVENDFVPEEIIQNNNEKSIKIDLGEAVNETIDYKKLTLQKLKSIVTEKGLTSDTSKLKKPDLLKLLGIE